MNNYKEYPTISKLSQSEKNHSSFDKDSIKSIIDRIGLIENNIKAIGELQVKIVTMINDNENALKEISGAFIELLNSQDSKQSDKKEINGINTKSIGDVIQLGKYNGKEIEWIVLDKKETSVLIVSKDIVDKRGYNKEYKNITWESCTLRSWLNNDFINNAFKQEEKELIMTTNVINKDNDVFGTPGGNGTKDQLFLLSIDEVKTYFSLDKERKAKQEYWLRSPGLLADFAAYVYSGGDVGKDGGLVNGAKGVRPACWIKI